MKTKALYSDAIFLVVWWKFTEMQVFFVCVCVCYGLIIFTIVISEVLVAVINNITGFWGVFLWFDISVPG
jgi:hypothetical protein